jgi:glutamate racemase
MALGIFDSGVGGLTVYKELSSAFPHTNMFYLGDTARVPYGNKSPETIIRYSMECACLLTDKYHVNALVVACNTISSYAVDKLKSVFGLPVLEVIQAGAEKALQVTCNGAIGVIGTIATIRSNSYVNMLKELSGDTVRIWQKACPLFVPLVEEGLITGDIPRLTIKFYLDELMKRPIDTLILACTHYPILAPLISELYPQIRIVDSATVMVEKIKQMGILVSESGRREILVTDASPAFESLKTMLVGNIRMKVIELRETGIA